MQERQGRVEPFTRTVGLPRGAWLNRTAAPLVSQEKKTSDVSTNRNQPARFSASSRRRNSPMWFQLANVWVTTDSKRLGAFLRRAE